MFARYFVEIPLARSDVEAALSEDPRRWLPGLANAAHRRGDQLLAEVGFGDALRIEREVRVEIGPPSRTPSTTVLPLSWEASDHPGLFPSLDAELEVAPLGPSLTQLGINARYVPPFRAIGRALDRAVLSRIAEVTLKDFLDHVAVAVSEPQVEPATPETEPRPTMDLTS
jgi:hypothetical protein